MLLAVVTSLTVCCSAVTIPQLAEKLGAKTLVQLVTKAGLVDTLSGPGKNHKYNITLSHR